MSIVKMKRLRIFGMASDCEELLRKLQHLGCVELRAPTQPSSDPGWQGFTAKSDGALANAQLRMDEFRTTLERLKRCSPTNKKGRFPSRPRITERELFDRQIVLEAEETVERVAALEKKRDSICAEQNKLIGQREALTPWLGLDVPLDTVSTKHVLVLFGTLSGLASHQAVEAALAETTELCQVQWAGRAGELQYVLVLCHRKAGDAARDALKSFGFTATSFRGWKGTARSNIDQIEDRQRILSQELEACRARLAQEAGHQTALQICIDRMTQDIQRMEAKEKLLSSTSTFFLEGWVPAEQLSDVEHLLSQYSAAWEATDPEPDEYPQVPVKLKNNRLTRPLNMVTDMYVYPAYDGVDPNPLMAPFFIFFFGMMMADMAYGLLMLAGGIFMRRKLRPSGTMEHMAGLLILCGISTFVMGALTGSFLGDFLPRLAKLIRPDTIFTALPALFTPLTDTLAILIGSLALGLLQVLTGMAISVVRKVQAGTWADALWDEGTWWIILAGVALAVVGIGNLGGYPIVLLIGLLMLLYGGTRNAKGFGKLTALIGTVYNGATGFFSDILSYARLMALMLAGSVIAQVFNTLGEVTGSVAGFVIISLVGNALNFMLNLLGCYVHDLRLQCLEFFGRFYKEGGKPFRPLLINTKYVDIKEED